MTRLIFALAFLLGAIAVTWIGLGFRHADLLALTVTVLIGAVYGLGFVELLGFRRATAGLNRQLASLPDSKDALNEWLGRLPAPLQPAIRRRLEGEPVALPGPMLTPYLLGLLVMLGLLGTFVGMIITLNGAASALEGSSELSAIRSALAAPIAGLSLAFGTSIAGVAASAMLGLAATISRRERVLASRRLDRESRQSLYHLTLNHQREQAYGALQLQSQAMPELVTAMQAMTARMEQVSEQLAGTLTRNQDSFHDAVSSQYQQLASSVAQALQESLSDSGRLAAEGIRPIVEQAMAQLDQQAEQTRQALSQAATSELAGLAASFRENTEQAASSWQQGLRDQRQDSERLIADVAAELTKISHQFHDNSNQLVTQVNTLQQQFQERSAQQLETVSERFAAATGQAADSWQNGLAQHQHATTTLADHFDQALQTHTEHFQRTTAELLGGQRQGLDTLTETLHQQLSSLADQENGRTEAASQRLEALEATVSRHLAELGTALEAPMTRLIETASETPKAAAEVITQLRQEMTRNSERDNELLAERERIMAELDDLLSSQREASAAQREAIETLITSAGQSLSSVSEAFAGQVSEQSQRLNAVASEVGASASEVASLSDAFQAAVQQFADANDTLVSNLQQVESSLEAAAARSDEQLAYYVEQAREVIDLSMTSQKDVIDALQELRGKSRAAEPSGVS